VRGFFCWGENFEEICGEKFSGKSGEKIGKNVGAGAEKMCFFDETFQKFVLKF